ncbi:hypothetical protein [Rickettsia endosymbiont of Orchestes rusci]
MTKTGLPRRYDVPPRNDGVFFATLLSHATTLRVDAKASPRNNDF